MRTNLSRTDRSTRAIVGILIILAGISFESWLGLAGAVLLLTAAINWCPLYALVGFRTSTRAAGKVQS